MTSKTISFVARDELAEWIEEEADRRMTTVSSTVQQIIAEKYREEQTDTSEPDEPEEDASETQEEMDESGDSAPDGPLERWEDKWWSPDSDNYEYAVRTLDGGRRYFETRAGAENALRELYGDDESDESQDGG